MDPEPIVVEQHFPVQPATVWRAVTDPKMMRQWYFEAIEDFRPDVGFETQFDVESSGRIFRHQWKVTDVVAGVSVTYAWRYEGYDGCGTTEWALEKTDDGTRLVVTFTGVESFPDDIPEFTRASCLAGWEYFVRQRLPDFLART